MSTKKNAKKVAKVAKVAALSAEVATIVTAIGNTGFATANAYADCVRLVGEVVKSTRTGSPRNRALEAAALAYKSGYVARSLLIDPAYQKKWGNMDQQQQMAEGALIIARASPQSTKDDRRTEQEHKACRAADVSWYKVRTAAGLDSDKSKSPTKNGRKPRPGSNKSEAPAAAEPPRDLVKTSPTFTKAFAKARGFSGENGPRDAVNDYFATAAAALLATVNKNAKLIDPKLSTAVADFHASLKAGGFIPSAE